MNDTTSVLQLVRDILETKPADEPDREELRRRFDALSRIRESLEYDLIPAVKNTMNTIEPAIYDLEKITKVLPAGCPVREGTEKLVIARKGRSLYSIWIEMDLIFKDLQKLQVLAQDKADELVNKVRED